MKLLIHGLACLGIAALAGCGDQAGGKQISASRNESHERPNFGSATDISKAGEPASNNVNAADNGLGGPAQRESGNYQRQPIPGQSSDQELAKQIKVALTTGSTGTTGTIAEDQLTKIDVQVQNGSVTLSGPVTTEAEKKLIEKQMSGFKGVKAVQNNLAVGGRNVQQKPLQPLVPRGSGNE
ncbi:MAG TPA: BON domain-containing protein [Verrucomicrobiae bacterium]|nr:BON domain-containing protein [Verrucomicrobiae bacterium]